MMMYLLHLLRKAHYFFIFFLSYSHLPITPLWGPYPIRVIIICLCQVHPSLLLHRRLSLIADDVVIAVVDI